jgi:tRNA pseudouridine38-40 synthase
VCPLRRRYVWGVRQALDLAAMDEAAALLTGTHDFMSFKNVGTPIGPRGTVRTLTALWREPGCRPGEVVWRFTADGFLKQMVRNIMGCLVAAGKGKVDVAGVRSILERRDRRHLMPTAPPQGLCMERVFYPEPVPRGQDTAHDEHQMAGRRAPDGPGREPAG